MAVEPDMLDSMLEAKSEGDSLGEVEEYSAAAGHVDEADAVTLVSSADTCTPELSPRRSCSSCCPVLVAAATRRWRLGQPTRRTAAAVALCCTSPSKFV